MTTINEKYDQNFNASLSWCLPAVCNLNCSYCGARDNREKFIDYLKNTNSGEEVTIDIPSMIKTLDKSNKVFNITFFSVGEPFLHKDIIAACCEVSKNNYVSLITNLTNPKIKEFSDRIDPKRVINIFASIHFQELERKKLFDTYIDNFLLLRARGFPVSAFAVAYPGITNEVTRYRKILESHGIKLAFNIFFGQYRGKKYPQSYTRKEAKIFDINHKPNSYYKKKCYAGYNAGAIFPNGDIKICNWVKEDIGNIYKEINFNPKMKICPNKFCHCPPPGMKHKHTINQKIVEYLSNSVLTVNYYIGQVGLFLKNHIPYLYSCLRKLKFRKVIF